MATLDSVLLVEIPEAEAAVRAHRHRLDPVSTHGVPAHVTALFPFVPADEIDAAVVERVLAVARRHQGFGYRFSSVDRFDGGVLYLPPEDPTPFVALMEDLNDAFPEHPPYGGLYPDTKPHLTVARSDDPAELDTVEAELRQSLPITGRAERLTLMAEMADGRWSRRGVIPLGS